MSTSTSSSKSKPQPSSHLHLHVGTTRATAAAPTTSNSSAASPGSSSSSHHSSRPASPAAAGGIGSGQACAACRYQRRKCGRNCELAPYFPADKSSRFVNAQRLFGVKNITKTLKVVGPMYAGDAMRALIYQADARAADPVGGCVTVIEELRRQIHNTETELQLVLQQIEICRQQASATNCDPAAAAAMILPAAFPGVAGGQQDLMIAAMDGIYAGQQLPIAAGDLPNNDPWSHQQQLYDYLCNNNVTAAGGEASVLAKATSDDEDGMQQSDSSVKDGSPEVALGEQLGQHCLIQELPFVDAFNVRPQVLHHGRAAAVDELRPQQKKVATPVLMKHEDDVDEHMQEQQATAGPPAPCHLKLGVSSFSNA